MPFRGLGHAFIPSQATGFRDQGFRVHCSGEKWGSGSGVACASGACNLSLGADGFRVHRFASKVLGF